MTFFEVLIILTRFSTSNTCQTSKICVLQIQIMRNTEVFVQNKTAGKSRILSK